MRRQIALPAAMFLIASTAGLLARQQPTFRSKTELVIVDAVVVDKDGNAVRGLKASDFALTDRKKPQAIATFEEVSHERPTNTGAAAALPLTLKLDVASNTTVQADRLVVVLIDDLHIWQGRTEKAKALARDVVAKLGGEASMAVVFTSREGSTQITQDRSGLLAAINGMKARQSLRRPRQGVNRRLPRVDPSAPAAVTLEGINSVARESLQDYYENLQYMKVVEDAANMLVHEDRRRKAFVLISEGVDSNSSGVQGGGSNLAEIVAQEMDLSAGIGNSVLGGMMNALRRANVTFYAIDPRGKVRAEDMDA